MLRKNNIQVEAKEKELERKIAQLEQLEKNKKNELELIKAKLEYEEEDKKRIEAKRKAEEIAKEGAKRKTKEEANYLTSPASRHLLANANKQEKNFLERNRLVKLV